VAGSNALTWMIRRQEGHQTSKNLCDIAQRFFFS